MCYRGFACWNVNSETFRADMCCSGSLPRRMGAISTVIRTRRKSGQSLSVLPATRVPPRRTGSRLSGWSGVSTSQSTRRADRRRPRHDRPAAGRLRQGRRSVSTVSPFVIQAGDDHIYSARSHVPTCPGDCSRSRTTEHDRQDTDPAAAGDPNVSLDHCPEYHCPEYHCLQHHAARYSDDEQRSDHPHQCGTADDGQHLGIDDRRADHEIQYREADDQFDHVGIPDDDFQ